MTGSDLSARWAAGVMRIGALYRGLPLTGGAVVGGSLPLGDLADRRTVRPAGLAVAFIDVQLLPEVAGVTIGTDVVAQRRAAGANGCLQRCAHRAHQPGTFGTR